MVTCRGLAGSPESPPAAQGAGDLSASTGIIATASATGRLRLNDLQPRPRAGRALGRMMPGAPCGWIRGILARRAQSRRRSDPP
jgi:hypothetical protein